MKKYEMLDETRILGTYKLHRIRALRDFGDVKRGDLGGWVESEKNLSHDGDCWVHDEACVYENAHVSGCAHVCNKVWLTDRAFVGDNALITGRAFVGGTVLVRCNAYVGGFVNIWGNTKLENSAYITSSDDYITVGPLGSRSDRTTFYLDIYRNIWVVCGCFNDTIESFEKAVQEIHGDSLYGQEYKCAIDYAKNMFEIRYPSRRNSDVSENILLM